MSYTLKIKHYFLITFLMPFGCFFSASITTPSIKKPQQLSSHLFKENKGQTCDQNCKPRLDGLFSRINKNLVYYLKTKGISYQTKRVDERKVDEMFEHKTNKDLLTEKRKLLSKITNSEVDINLIQINKSKTHVQMLNSLGQIL